MNDHSAPDDNGRTESSSDAGAAPREPSSPPAPLKEKKVAMSADSAAFATGEIEAGRLSRALRGWILPVVISPALLALAFAIFGSSGLGGGAIGLGLGFASIGCARLFASRQADARGADLLRETLLGSFTSFAIFIAGIIILSRAWREAMVPAAVTGLGLYLITKYASVLSATRPRGPSSSGGPSPPSEDPRP